MRKSAMLTRHVTYEQDCLLCKVVQGLGFTAFGAFNAWRARSMWSYLGGKDRIFNVTAVGVIFTIAALNFAMAYRIQAG